MDTETRNYLQDFNEGDENDSKLFWYESTQSDTSFLGVQIGGIIYYVATRPNSNQCFVMIGINFFREGIENIYEYSEPRFKCLQKSCPTLCQVILDGSNDRFDRGAVVAIENHYLLAIKLNYNILRDLENNPDIFTDEDSVVSEAAIQLLNCFKDIHDEIDQWDGFSTFDEVKIAAQEMLPGIRWGLRLGTLFG